MSYYEAKEDNVRIERKNGFTVYLPPCSVCGKPVKSWSYIRGNNYRCADCKIRGYKNNDRN